RVRWVMVAAASISDREHRCVLPLHSCSLSLPSLLPPPSKLTQTNQNKVSPNQPNPSKISRAKRTQPHSLCRLSPEEERLRQRMLLRERLNKGWDIQPE